MKKAKRILAMVGVILLVGMYASTLVFALMDSPAARGLLMGSIYCTIAVPVLLYAMTLISRRLRDKGEEIRKEQDQQKKEENGDAGK